MSSVKADTKCREGLRKIVFGGTNIAEDWGKTITKPTPINSTYNFRRNDFTSIKNLAWFGLIGRSVNCESPICC